VSADRILVVEDEDTIANNLVRALAANGYSVQRVRTGQDALAAVSSSDLVLLDLGLPDADGIEVCREMRSADPLLPIVMLTARQTEIDLVIGLDAGAVDYIAKPFRLAELLARIRVQLRRLPSPVDDAATIVVGDLTIDTQAYRAHWAGTELELRTKEFELLVTLAANAGHVVTRERLMSEVWDEHWFGSTKTLDVHVAALRRKLADHAGGSEMITTIRSVGYRYERPSQAGTTI